MTLKNKEDMPYEKFESMGVKSLTDCELLAVIIRNGYKDIDAVKLASKILKSTGEDSNAVGLTRISYEDLIAIKGIGKVKAIQICSIVELCERMATQSRKKRLDFSRPATIADYYMEQLRHKETETVIAAYVDMKGRLLQSDTISNGSVNGSVISAREIYIKALKHKASGVILVHNHPSGDPTPSDNDLVITKRIIEAGMLLDIPLMDHIIIGDNKYISLRSMGFFERSFT